jgi:hypothetical protein
MSLWEAINDVLFSLASGFGKGVASEFVPLTQIGAALVRNGTLKDYGSGTATKKQLDVVLSETKKHGGECEIKIKGNEVYIKVTFNNNNSSLPNY